MEWSSPRTSRSTTSKPKNAKQLKTSANFYSSNDHDTGLYVTESILGFFSPRDHCELQFSEENAKSTKDGKDSSTKRNPNSQNVSLRQSRENPRECWKRKRMVHAHSPATKGKSQRQQLLPSGLILL